MPGPFVLRDFLRDRGNVGLDGRSSMPDEILHDIGVWRYLRELGPNSRTAEVEMHILYDLQDGGSLRRGNGVEPFVPNLFRALRLFGEQQGVHDMPFAARSNGAAPTLGSLMPVVFENQKPGAPLPKWLREMIDNADSAQTALTKDQLGELAKHVKSYPGLVQLLAVPEGPPPPPQNGFSDPLAEDPDRPRFDLDEFEAWVTSLGAGHVRSGTLTVIRTLPQGASLEQLEDALIGRLKDRPKVSQFNHFMTLAERFANQTDPPRNKPFGRASSDGVRWRDVIADSLGDTPALVLLGRSGARPGRAPANALLFDEIAAGILKNRDRSFVRGNLNWLVATEEQVTQQKVGLPADGRLSLARFERLWLSSMSEGLREASDDLPQAITTIEEALYDLRSDTVITNATVQNGFAARVQRWVAGTHREKTTYREMWASQEFLNNLPEWFPARNALDISADTPATFGALLRGSQSFEVDEVENYSRLKVALKLCNDAKDGHVLAADADITRDELRARLHVEEGKIHGWNHEAVEIIRAFVGELHERGAIDFTWDDLDLSTGGARRRPETLSTGASMVSVRLKDPRAELVAATAAPDLERAVEPLGIV